MSGLLRAEWIKLRTVTMNWVLTIIALGFPLTITLLTAFFRGDDNDFDTRQLLETVSGTAFIPVLLLGVIAAASITGEFGFGTIRPTFTATPRRARVMLAKAIVLVTFSVSLVAFTTAVGTFGGRAVAKARGMWLNLGDEPTAYPMLAGLVLLGGMMALAGLGIGMLIRNTPAAIAVFILWPLMIEALLGGLLSLVFGEEVFGWMPFRAGFQLGALELFDGPSRLVSGLYFLGVAVGLCLLGTWSVNRRDA